MNDNSLLALSILMIISVLVAGFGLGLSQHRSDNNVVEIVHDDSLSECEKCVSQFNISDTNTVHKLENLNGVAMYSYRIMQDHNDTDESITMKRKVINTCFDVCTNDNGLILTKTKR